MNVTWRGKEGQDSGLPSSLERLSARAGARCKDGKDQIGWGQKSNVWFCLC